jgi:ubiquinone/menaquinone biosynthesis C-methylase UbiE
VNIETAVFPAPDEQFDVIVWNRDLVTVKNVVAALQEVNRVLRPRGVLVVAAGRAARRDPDPGPVAGGPHR